MVGYTGAEPNSGRTAYKMKGYAEPEHRRRGIMRLIESKLIAILRERGMAPMHLLVDSSNREGKATWLARGCETVRQTMRKRL